MSGANVRRGAATIAHEILKTFDPSIDRHPKDPPGTILKVGQATVVIGGAKKQHIPVEIAVREERRNRPVRDVPKIQRKPIRSEPKPGRNQPCPCGSGRKWKRCCGGVRFPFPGEGVQAQQSFLRLF
jgi:hypothetical protein